MAKRRETRSDDPGSRAERLRDILEDEILTGIHPPGTRLEEVALAERFGVSRTPIREALFHLTASGLAEHRPRRGTTVTEIGPRRLIEMFEVMAELEAMCARLAARRATEDDLAEISALHQSCAEAADSRDVDAYYYENERFHERIRLAARNAFLTEQAGQLHKRLRPYRRLQLRARDRVAGSYAEHDSIVAALRGSDAGAAADAMRAHISIQGERFADLIATLESLGTAAE